MNSREVFTVARISTVDGKLLKAAVGFFDFRTAVEYKERWESDGCDVIITAHIEDDHGIVDEKFGRYEVKIERIHGS